MNRKAFTLTELLITVLVLSILSAASLVVWNSMIEKTRQAVCLQNELILLEAMKFYIYDNEAVPTSLSKLVPEYTDFAIASLKKSKPHVLAMRKIYLALLDIDEGSIAWAKPPNFKNYLGMNARVLRCPSKKGSGISYGFADFLTKDSFHDKARSKVYLFKLLEAYNLPIIADCSKPTFTIGTRGALTNVDYRHNHTIWNKLFGGELDLYGKAMIVTGKKNKFAKKHNQRHDGWKEPTCGTASPPPGAPLGGFWDGDYYYIGNDRYDMFGNIVQ